MIILIFLCIKFAWNHFQNIFHFCTSFFFLPNLTFSTVLFQTLFLTLFGLVCQPNLLVIACTICLYAQHIYWYAYHNVITSNMSMLFLPLKNSFQMLFFAFYSFSKSWSFHVDSFNLTISFLFKNSFPHPNLANLLNQTYSSMHSVFAPVISAPDHTTTRRN